MVSLVEKFRIYKKYIVNDHNFCLKNGEINWSVTDVVETRELVETVDISSPCYCTLEIEKTST